MKFRAWLGGTLLLGIPAVALAASWWNEEWQFRKEVSLDTTPAAADIAGSAQDVPVLVRLSLVNFSYFNDAKPDGADFRVVSGDDKTPLKFHFERYDAQNQMAFLWVRMPQVTGASTADKFNVYYGNPDAPAAGDPAGTYDTNQALVLQFSEADGKPADVTAYKNQPSASTAESSPASLVGGGLKFNGTQSVTVPSSASLRLVPTKGFTASAWVKLDAAQARAHVLVLEDQGRQLVLGIDGMQAFVTLASRDVPVAITQEGPGLTPGTWHFLAVTVSPTQVTLYADGLAVGSAPVTPVELAGTLTLGATAAGTNGYVGELDEVQVATVARSADWLKAAARSQGIEAPLVVYGADGQKEGGSNSYFATIAKNLTFDGWVVIVICLVMLVMAIVIIVTKALHLGGVEKQNARFLAAYEKLKGDPRQLETTIAAERDTYGASTLYSLYHTGMQEIDKRIPPVEPGAKPAAVLSAQSIEAIRSTLDATATRQLQKLSAQMVLLTIAISGGPFLGLLGTVIGVMITFAAIALSGDVNVNAIAPGTAAALAATVAGLAVAIPALFGYNWLNTRIKSISADNRVFVDELVSRSAEQYS